MQTFGFILIESIHIKNHDFYKNVFFWYFDFLHEKRKLCELQQKKVSDK